MKDRELLVALTGQPNVGKSTVFNIITGLSQHVGNWPGKTVEKKEGVYQAGTTRMKIVDLPGSYSLTAYSEEEKITRDFIITEKPDVVVLIANASALERNLYLLAEFLLLNTPLVVGLNMMDVAEEQGITLDLGVLEKYLGVPVIPLIASKNKGIKDLVEAVISLSSGNYPYRPFVADVAEDHKELFIELQDILESYVSPPHLLRWTVTKIMEGDPDVTESMKKAVPEREWDGVEKLLRGHEDSLHAVVHGRYDWIEGAVSSSVSGHKRGQVLVTDRLDHILTRPVFGIPILLGVLAVVFMLTYGLGLPLQELLESFMNAFASSLAPLLKGSAWAGRVLIEGVIGGAGTVLTFLPILAIFFASMAFLEDVGYTARAAFVMDKFMHFIGLHGKSFLPFCLGFGCNVPAVMGARAVESGSFRIFTILLTPFIPCTAKLAVVALVASAVFPEKALFVSVGLIAGNILFLGLVGRIGTSVFLKHQPTPFILELPLYHRPNFKTIGLVAWRRVASFVKTAGTIIVVFSVLLWILSHVPGGEMETSVLSWMGRAIEPLGQPIGLDWKMIVALLSSVAARENAIAALSVLYGVGEEGLRDILPAVMTPASALSFLVILMLFVPCVATIAVMRQEIGKKMWFYYAMGFMVLVSYLMGVAAYQLALIIGL
jgi:ferrous iron transport protein B